ncbi:MAG: hypothetical protein LDL33_09800 [Desulfomonile sp.]|nr:hypothetical protein [Desulfomonile sp.]
MGPALDKPSALEALKAYIANLQDSSPYWRVQAAAWGIALVVVIAGGVLFALLALTSVFGGGSVTYEAKGSPGPVIFRHYTHMWFQEGKYKDCKTCHDKLFATQKYGTYVLRALYDSPPRKYRIGKDSTTLFVPAPANAAETDLVTYETQRVCSTCATGNCHDGKESFSRMECLQCHQRR